MLFQSTPPARGATPPSRGRPAALPISIHAPREGGDGALGTTMTIRMISIHAPREGGDHNCGVHGCAILHFNPRPPRGGRLQPVGGGTLHPGISIHAPREGGDTMKGY